MPRTQKPPLIATLLFFCCHFRDLAEMVHASETVPFCGCPYMPFIPPLTASTPSHGVIGQFGNEKRSTGLKTPFSPSSLCHSPSVAPLLLSLCPGIPPTLPPFHALRKPPAIFPRSVELPPVLPSCFHRASRHKNRHPRELTQLSGCLSSVTG